LSELTHILFFPVDWLAGLFSREWIGLIAVLILIHMAPILPLGLFGLILQKLNIDQDDFFDEYAASWIVKAVACLYLAYVIMVWLWAIYRFARIIL